MAKKATKKKAAKKTAKKTSKVAKVAKKASKKKASKKKASAKLVETQAEQVVSEAITPSRKKKVKKVSAKLGKKVSIRVNPDLLKKRKASREEVVEEEEEYVEEIGLSIEQLQKCKSGLTKAEIKKYRQMLSDHRAELLSDVQSLQTESSNQSGNLSSVPVHMADLGSDSYEQERTLGLIESDQKLLGEIVDAIERIDNNYYGVCVETGDPIGKARLDAKPWAKYTIEVVMEKERLGQI